MKKIYISCYENADKKYMDSLIKSNEDRKNSVFDLINKTNESLLDKITNKSTIVESIKKNVLRDTEVCVFLIGPETNKRKEVDWIARAAMSSHGVLEKTGILIIYLPEIVSKYVSKIPHSVLPPILEKNIRRSDVYMVETTWRKISLDFYNLEKFLYTAADLARISNYELDDEILMHNLNKYPF